MKIQVPLFIQAIKYNHTDEFTITVHSLKQESSQYSIVIDIDETVVDIETLDFTQADFKNGHIEKLHELKKSTQAETQLKLNSLDEQIESLLAIEHKEGM